MVAIAVNYLNNFLSRRSTAFVVAFLMMSASWGLSLTANAHLALALSSVCVLFLLFVVTRVSSAGELPSSTHQAECSTTSNSFNSPSQENDKTTNILVDTVADAGEILSVTSSNINDVYATQSDAVATLSNAFISLQTLLFRSRLLFY